MAETDYRQMWYDLWQPIANKHNIPDAGAFDREAFEAALIEAYCAYLLDVYRDELRQEYSGIPLDGIDPLVMRVVALHHWPIDDAENLTNRELMISLAEDLNHFVFPDLAAKWVYGQLRELGLYKAKMLLSPHMTEDLRKQLS